MRVKTAVIQLSVGERKDENLDRAEARISDAAKNGARLIVLPEMFNCPYDVKMFASFAEEIPFGKTARMLSCAAKKHAVTIVGGSLPEVAQGKIYNSSPVFNVHGRLIALHRKIHLFDISLKSVKVKESSILSGGEKITIFKSPIGPMGLIVCFDIRFPELFMEMGKKGVVAVVMPGAFTLVTGSAHWHMLMRSRAVDNQIYMVASSPARNKKGYQAFGHSLISDPFGIIMAEAATGEKTIYADLSTERVREVRSMLPLKRNVV